MSDEELIKCLEKSSKLDCTKCWQRGENCDGDDCEKVIAEKALDLINRQQAKIEKLKWENTHFEFKVDDLNGKLEKFKEYRDIKNGAYEREIERLQSLCTSNDVIIKAQEAEIERLQKKYDRAMDNLKAVLKERAGEQNA